MKQVCLDVMITLFVNPVCLMFFSTGTTVSPGKLLTNQISSSHTDAQVNSREHSLCKLKTSNLKLLKIPCLPVMSKSNYPVKQQSCIPSHNRVVEGI